MPIARGTILGTFEITGHIGSGGMGEVYRAHDTKLSRDVAIKVLPEQFAREPERLARFQREAKMLAALNHPNISAIYGLEQSGNLHYLVMELVEGSTLAERVRSAPVPVDETLAIARQVADAVEYAHERNVIHRDLKPANIKVTPAGVVKVLDFGLAKAMSDEPSPADIANSPTLSMAATQHGVILGTASYMSPEQARGRAVDKRTDIWAFGCVLYELLTGKQAFHGEDVAEILAAVMKTEPDWSRLPDNTPPTIRTLLRRCLQKDRALRLRDAGDARIEISEALAAAPAEPATAKASGSPLRTASIFGLAALLIGAAAATLITWNLRPASPRPVTRLALTLQEGEHLPLLNTPVVALSPDGSQVAFVSVRDRKQQIYLRPFDSAEVKPLPGTEGAENPFFSPNGKSLGFFSDGKLMKVSLDGGVPLAICETFFIRGASWGDNDTIVFASGFGTDGLSQVPAAGGKPQAITTKDPATGEEAHRWPQLLPGSKAVLFTAWSRNLDDSLIVVQRLDTKEKRILVRGGTYARYVPTGHIVYARAGSLMAVPFDLSRLQVTGDPISVAEGEGVSLDREGNAQFAISETGSLVYVPGGLQGADRTMVWVDRKGAEQPLMAPPRNYLAPRLSPDGQRVAAAISGANDDVWIYDIPRQALARLTFGARSLTPVWTPDGKRIVYRSNRAGSLNLFWKLADGSGEEERLTTSQLNQTPLAVSPDGQSLIFKEGQALSVLPLAGDRKSRLFFETTSNTAGAEFSPDGRWLAYASDESGRNEIYVRPFPSGTGRWQISTEGGAQPLWSRSGEIFYRDGDKTMAVQIATQPAVTVGKPRLLFEKPYVTIGGSNSSGMTPDGQRFLMLKAGEEEQEASQINVVLNWSEDLKRRVLAGEK